MIESRPDHLRDLADPNVDTIVLVPGLDGTAQLFYRQIPLLAARFNVVAFPLPNRRPATMEDLIGDLAALVEEVSDRPVILCGESFGGALSMGLALERPHLVAGLVIVNSFPYLSNRLQLLLAPKITKVLPWVAMPAIRRITEHRLHSSHTLDEDLREFRQRMQGVGRDGYIQRLELLRDYDIRPDLGRLDVPTLFIAGTEDRLLPSSRWADYMGRRVTNAKVVHLEGYGHCCLINHDLDLAELVGNWWDAEKADSST